MRNYPHGNRNRNDEFYEIENEKIKYRIDAYFVNDGLQFAITLIGVKFDYFVVKNKKESKKYSFDLRKYKVTHNHEYHHNREFDETKMNEIIVYPNSIAPYLSPLYNINIKPKELLLYFCRNGNRVVINY